MKYKDYYAAIGKLLYAAADIDGVITAKEKQKLQGIVKRELAPVESGRDAAGTNLAYYSEMEFDFLDEEIADAETAFESFIDFVEEHYTVFDQAIKKTTRHIVRELANAYYGTNKKEEILITRLNEKLKKLGGH